MDFMIKIKFVISEFQNIIGRKLNRKVQNMETRTFCELKDRSQITIPKNLVKKLNLKPGDILQIEEQNGRLLLIPSVVLPKDQAWFYTKEWQEDENRVDRELKNGKGIKVSDKKDMLKELDLNDK
jgi:antitoxin MazE